jgi:hypothetical protein
LASFKVNILHDNTIFTVVIAVSTRQDVSVPSAYTAELDRSSQACTWGELRREFNIYRMGKNEKWKELPV